MTLIQPGPELQLKIRNELNEDVQTRDDHLKIIKEWIQQQPHLPKDFDDACLMTFLRGCKFGLEKTKRKLDMYFSMRNAVPEFFANRNVRNPELVRIMEAINIPPLPGLTADGRRVIIMRATITNVTDYEASDAMKLVLMIGDIRLFAEQTGVAGDVYILDATGANAVHFAKFTPTLIKKFAICVQEAYPVKLKEIHIVNVSPFVESVVNFVKPFIKEKIRNRIFFHSGNNFESLHKKIPKSILPVEYGGTAGKIQDFHDDWFKKLEDHTDWFKKQESIKSDESKRTGKPHNIDDLFGVEGSFRQLNID